MKEELQKLIEQYGADAVAKAAAEAANQHVPTINTPVVTDEQLINTISQLDAAVTDILEAGRKNEETYKNKTELARRARQLETSIQITEAEAINTICGTGKDAYGIIPYPDGTGIYKWFAYDLTDSDPAYNVTGSRYRTKCPYADRFRGTGYYDVFIWNFTNVTCNFTGWCTADLRISTGYYF